ncbi:MlaD family protein [Mycobacteroides chelonae]|uniref:MlaD family protein n=1 Tax=Mycobacteroides chelonae TaxID=1774 RepID=UPI0008A8A6B6|nr:MlaD family protein [Mycobacteroides chelonae]OHU32942.1 mammalian cell entry protein [Mycobacteroides chelonae]
MIETLARGVLTAVDAARRRQALLSGLALAAILALAVTYLINGALRLSPLSPTYRVTLQLNESGGLLPNQDVTFHGAPVGRVESVIITPNTVNALVDIDARVKIPKDSAVSVSGLSPAGEQYVDFAAKTNAGPYLSDGSTIALGRASTPVTLAQLLADSDGTLAQIDPRKLALIKKELSLGADAPRKLTEIVDGGTFLLSTLDSVLPQTVSLLRSSRIVLSTAADVNPGIAATTKNIDRILRGVGRMDNGYRALVDTTPRILAALDNVFADNSDIMVQLLGNLTTVARLAYLRVPALHALFPDYRGSTLEALSSMLHDNGLWATADIYPRYGCDYGTPSVPASTASYPEPFLYAYCPTDDPAVLVRGAKNAPRPAGDDTAGPPAGADLTATTDPTPTGRFTIPTPHGGPTLPIEPPR